MDDLIARAAAAIPEAAEIASERREKASESHMMAMMIRNSTAPNAPASASGFDMAAEYALKTASVLDMFPDLIAALRKVTAERDKSIAGWSASQDKHITALDKIEVLQSTIEQLHGPLSVATLEARAEAAGAEVATLRAELDAARGRDAGDDDDAAFDNDAVYQFSRLMREKMARSRAKGRSGWNDPAKCSPDYLRSLLYEHIYKGDPVDVANLCMMLRHYDEPTTPRPEDDLRLPFAARGRVKRPHFIENRYGDAAAWEHKSDYGRYVYGIDFAGKAYSQTPNTNETDHADIGAAEAFVVAEYRATVHARILAALEPDPTMARMREALEDCLEWMEATRACGDCGNWDWTEGDEYSRGRAALKEE